MNRPDLKPVLEQLDLLGPPATQPIEPASDGPLKTVDEILGQLTQALSDHGSDHPEVDFWRQKLATALVEWVVS